MTKPTTLAVLRGALLAILVLGMVGTGIELLLLPHTDGFWQLIPLVLLAAGFAVVCWYGLSRSAASLRVLQLLMLGFLLSGCIGLLLHFQGNVEFELEMHPAASGWGLFLEAVRGATPTLAPGTMIQLGLVGLLYTFRHPQLQAVGATNSTES